MDKINQIIAWEVLFIIVFSSLIVIQEVDNHGLKYITGRVVTSVPKETILAELEEFLPKLDFLKDVDNANVCIIVNMGDSVRYSYEVVKIAGAVAVTQSQNFLCKGEQNEDFIFSYVSYEKLKEHIDNVPSFDELRRTSDGTNLYVYPSKYILPGLRVANRAEFEDKFGTFIRKYFTEEEIEQFLTSAPEERAPLAFPSYLFYIIGGLVLVVLIVSVLLLKLSKKPEIGKELEIVSYIKSMESQGYEEEQIKQALVDSGWSEEEIQKALQTVNTEVTMPPAFS